MLLQQASAEASASKAAFRPTLSIQLQALLPPPCLYPQHIQADMCVCPSLLPSPCRAATSIPELLQTLKEERRRQKVAARHGRAQPQAQPQPHAHAHAGNSDAAAATVACSGAAARSGPSGPVGRQPRNRNTPDTTTATSNGKAAADAAPPRMPQAVSKDAPQPLQPPAQPARPQEQPRSPVPARAAEAAPAAEATAPVAAPLAAATATAAALSPQDQDAPPAPEPTRPPYAVKKEPTDAYGQPASSTPRSRRQQQQQQQATGSHPQVLLAKALPGQQQAQRAQQHETCEDTCYAQADRISGGGDGDDSEGTTVVHGSPTARRPFTATGSQPSPTRAVARWVAGPGAGGPTAQQEEPQRPAGPSATMQAPPAGAEAMDIDERAAPSHGEASLKRTDGPEAEPRSSSGGSSSRSGGGGGNPAKVLTSSIAHRILEHGVSAIPLAAAPYGQAVPWRVQQRRQQHDHDHEQDEDVLRLPLQQHQQPRDAWAAGGGQAPGRLQVQPLRGPAAAVQLPLPVAGRKRTMVEADDVNGTDSQEQAAGALPARGARPQQRDCNGRAPPAPPSPRPAGHPEAWAPLPEPKRGCRWEQEEVYGGASGEASYHLEERQQQQQGGAAAYSARAAATATAAAQQGARQSPVLGMRAAGLSPRAAPLQPQLSALDLAAAGPGCWGAGAGMGRRLSSSGSDALQLLAGSGSLPASATAAAAAARAASGNLNDVLLDADRLLPHSHQQRSQAAVAAATVAAADGRLALDQVDVLALLRGATLHQRTQTQQQQQQQHQEEQCNRLDADRSLQRQLQHSVGNAGADPQRHMVARPSARSLLLQLLALQQLEEEEAELAAAAVAAARRRRALQPLSEAGPVGGSQRSASVATSSVRAVVDARGGGGGGSRAQDLTPTGPTGDGDAGVQLQATAERHVALSRQGSLRQGQMGTSCRPPPAAQVQVLVQGPHALNAHDSRLGVVVGGGSGGARNGMGARYGREGDAMDAGAELDAGGGWGPGGRAVPGRLGGAREETFTHSSGRVGGSSAADSMAAGGGQRAAWHPPAYGPDGTAQWEEYEGGLLLRQQPRARVLPGRGGLAGRTGSGGSGGGRTEAVTAAGAGRWLGGAGAECGGRRGVGSSEQPAVGKVLQLPPARVVEAAVDARQGVRGDRQLPIQVLPAGLADPRRQQGVHVVYRDAPAVVLERPGSGVCDGAPRAGAAAAAGQHQLQLQQAPRVAARIDGGEGCGRIIVDVPPGVALQLLGLLAGHR